MGCPEENILFGRFPDEAGMGRHHQPCRVQWPGESGPRERDLHTSIPPDSEIWPHDLCEVVPITRSRARIWSWAAWASPFGVKPSLEKIKEVKKLNTNILTQYLLYDRDWQTFFSKGPDSKYFRACGHVGLYHIYSTLLLWGENKWEWPCSNKTLLTKTDAKSDLAQGP